LPCLAVKKEMIEQQTKTDLAQPQLSVGTLLNFEYFTPTGDVETEIRAALLALENDENLGYTSINRGVWLLETGINYLIPDNLYDYDSVFSTLTNLRIALNDQEELNELELKNALISIYNTINSTIDSETKHIGSDVYVESIDNSIVNLEVKHFFLAGITGILTQTGLPVGTTNQDRVAGYPYKCPYLPGNKTNAAWIEARDNARIALRSYWGNSNSNPKFYSNAVRYSSITRPYPTLFISSEHLLGNPNAYVSTHQSSVDAELCVTASEQNQYAQAIYDNVSLKTVKTRGLLDMVVANHNNWVYNQTPNYWESWWHYRDVVVGENGWFAPNLPTLTLSYL
jgi:hypothetical protein